ncbi:MAG: ATP-binding protein [Bacteroidota bacterium]
MQESLQAISTFNTDSQFHAYFMHGGQEDFGFSFFYFESGKLKFWSDNTIVLPENAATENIASGSVLELPDGLYEAFEKSAGNKKIIGLILLRQTFSYQNKYLENHFNPLLKLDEQFMVAGEEADYQLKSAAGSTLFTLNTSHSIPDELPFKTPAWFYLFAFVFFFSGILLYFQNLKANTAVILLTGVILFFVRFTMIRFRLPGEMYYNDFFSPKIYGSSFFFNSIGDFFLNAVTLFTFTGIIYGHFKKAGTVPNHSAGNYLLFIPALSALALAFYAIHNLVGDLVLNSKIIFEPSISDFDINTFIAALSILLLLWSFYFLCAAVTTLFRNIFPFKNSIEKFSSFRRGLFAILVISVYASFLVDKNLEEKKLENQKLFAQRMDSRRDQLAEYLFTDLEKKIVSDSIVKEIVASNKDVTEKVTQHLQQNFFNGYFTKFDVAVSVFDKSGTSFDSIAGNTLAAEEEEFHRGKSTASAMLTLQPDESGKLKYLAILKLYDSAGVHIATIVNELTARSVQLAEGFPELLVSNTVIKNRDESNYSYARYSNSSLIYAGGNFPYPFHSNAFGKSVSDFSSLTMDGYKHVIFRPSSTSCVVVSRPAESFFDRLSLFSYLLLFFLAVFLSVHLFLYILLQKNKFQLSLKQRIRTSIISLVIVSFVLIAAGTSVYIVRKYDSDKNKTILSRLNAMWFAITDHFSFDNSLSAAPKSQWTGELNSIVSSFNLDFNLYDESGNLFYSSQPKLFEKGIISTRINPEAFYEMQQYGKTQFVHAENIGSLNYAAAYAPFTDRAGNIAGYLNLPYFEKQNELNKEISGFISALINIYLLLLVVSLLLALFISSRITKPLLLIQERLSLIRLGSKNEIIEWKRNDEIGLLVQEYNKMVIALAESAELLSRSERESAWREMAQQVAHEIKNPLTPMKLSVQHLQRAWNEKSGNLDELFQRISKTMIEQIDALSNIASEFGNFAKMPRAKNEMVELDEILRSSINLFNDTPGVSIEYHHNGIERKIFADREQLIRAFSNIIKNAIQAIPENKKGVIVIDVKSENNNHLISVSDNGTGIPVSLQSKIFTPNFTTKTSGMGLGLAMVKSTIDSIGATIRFETTEGKGSVFYISIPGYTNPAG